ncbi:hypothetical protein [Streptomyces sp. SLBN-8D4]|uniref:hypothetical protein n=1 Tax=Streptomyces sp. SLBN-8D4 TaxID=3377728 RepID=UPI003C7D9C18
MSKVPQWFPAIKEASFDGTHRHLRGPEGATMKSLVVTKDDELRRFQYRFVEGMPQPIEFHLGTFDVLPEARAHAWSTARRSSRRPSHGLSSEPWAKESRASPGTSPHTPEVAMGGSASCGSRPSVRRAEHSHHDRALRGVSHTDLPRHLAERGGRAPRSGLPAVRVGTSARAWRRP